MDHLQTIIDDVAGWDENEAGGDSILRLRNGTALRAAHDDPRHAAWRYAATRHEGPVYVQFDPATQSIAALYMGIRELANAVEPSSAGKTVITFKLTPSFYFVDSSRADAAEMIERFNDALERRQALFVISHPSTREILAVRPVVDETIGKTPSGAMTSGIAVELSIQAGSEVDATLHFAKRLAGRGRSL